MLNATLEQRVDITDTLFIITVKPDDGVPDFHPGQYIALGLPGSAERLAGCEPDKTPLKPDKLIKRAYSIGSAPHEKDGYEFYIALVPDGAFTPRLAALQVGERLFAAKRVVGTFTIQQRPAADNLILVATGTGLAPYICMVRDPSSWPAGREISIVHGVRYSYDFAYREELLELERRNDKFHYYSTVSRDDPEWRGERGYVQRFFEEGIIQLDSNCDHVFICGNPAMIDDLQKLLETKGYTVHSKKNPGNLHLEKYW